MADSAFVSADIDKFVQFEKKARKRSKNLTL